MASAIQSNTQTSQCRNGAERERGRQRERSWEALQQQRCSGGYFSGGTRYNVIKWESNIKKARNNLHKLSVSVTTHPMPSTPLVWDRETVRHPHNQLAIALALDSWSTIHSTKGYRFSYVILCCLLPRADFILSPSEAVCELKIYYTCYIQISTLAKTLQTSNEKNYFYDVGTEHSSNASSVASLALALTLGVWIKPHYAIIM